MPRRATCPGCTRPLTVVKDGDPQTCPWLCTYCSRGFWNAELAHAEQYDPLSRSFGALWTVVLAACDQELAAAEAAVTG